jgi:hypothetical protein
MSRHVYVFSRILRKCFINEFFEIKVRIRPWNRRSINDYIGKRALAQEHLKMA